MDAVAATETVIYTSPNPGTADVAEVMTVFYGGATSGKIYYAIKRGTDNYRYTQILDTGNGSSILPRNTRMKDGDKLVLIIDTPAGTGQKADIWASGAEVT